MQGVLNGDSVGVVWITTATQQSGVGLYVITAGSIVGPKAQDYSLTVAGANVMASELSVTPAPLAIRANSVSRLEHQPNPELTVSYDGFVLGDGPWSLSSAPIVSTSATISSFAGTYAITVSGASASNYVIRYVDGTLTVLPLPPVTVVGIETEKVRVHEGKGGKAKWVPMSAIVVQYSEAVQGAGNRDTYHVYRGRRVKGQEIVYSRPVRLVSVQYNAATHAATVLTSKVALGTPEELRITASLILNGDNLPLQGNQPDGDYVGTIPGRG